MFIATTKKIRVTGVRARDLEAHGFVEDMVGFIGAFAAFLFLEVSGTFRRVIIVGIVFRRIRRYVSFSQVMLRHIVLEN